MVEIIEILDLGDIEACRFFQHPECIRELSFMSRHMERISVTLC